MKCPRVEATASELLDPANAVWQRVPSEKQALTPTPLAMQPSEYIQNKWKTLSHGAITEVVTAAAHNGQEIYFRLEWADPTDDGHPADLAAFPDQAGVMLPIKEDAVMMEMGTADQPVNMWLWRADVDPPRYVTATGRGTTTYLKDSPLAGKATRTDKGWSVVISRPFHITIPAELTVPLAPGMTHKCTFAVWQGSGQERGGLKAFQQRWQPLEIAS